MKASSIHRVGAFAGLLLGLSCLAGAQTYTVVEIGSQGVQSDASWLNKKGQVVGGDETIGAFIWQAATGKTALGGLHSGGPINSAGQIAGTLLRHFTASD